MAVGDNTVAYVKKCAHIARLIDWSPGIERDTFNNAISIVVKNGYYEKMAEFLESKHDADYYDMIGKLNEFVESNRSQ